MILLGLCIQLMISAMKNDDYQFVVTPKMFGWTNQEIPASEILPFVIAPEVIGWTTKEVSSEYIATKDNYDELLINFAQHHLH